MPPSREFMLSFDDGPLPNATERVLDALAILRTADGEPVAAGFFLVGDVPEDFWRRRSYYACYEIWTLKGSIVKFPEITRRISEAGHVIGNHTAHHAWFRWPWLNTAEAVRSELRQWEAMAEPVLGKLRQRLFRSPYLIDTKTVRSAVRELGYRPVAGRAVGDTTPGMRLEWLKANVVKILKNWDRPYPCVLIFHDGQSLTHEHLAEIVRHLQRSGFRLARFDVSRLPPSD